MFKEVLFAWCHIDTVDFLVATKFFLWYLLLKHEGALSKGTCWRKSVLLFKQHWLRQWYTFSGSLVWDFVFVFRGCLNREEIHRKKLWCYVVGRAVHDNLATAQEFLIELDFLWANKLVTIILIHNFHSRNIFHLQSNFSMQKLNADQVASEVRWARALNQNQTMQSFDFKLNFKILAL